MLPLTIAASSFLIPSNKAWKELSDNFDVDFSDYGDWFGALSKSDKDKIIAIVIFIDDLLTADENSFHISWIMKKLNLLFDAVEQRLLFSKQPLVALYSSLGSYNLITSAKKQNIKKTAYFIVLEKMYSLAATYSNFYFVDLDTEFCKKGMDLIIDSRNWYFAHCRISTSGLGIISNSLSRILNKIYKPSSKVLVLDCDNTLWGGVIGEDGLSGISLGNDGIGKAYQDFQSIIKRMASEGVLVTLASKNDESAVWDVFENHNGMILKRDQIVSWRINWKNKADNIKCLSNELDLGLDSFVFWDDNPMERDLVRSVLPEIFTVEVPENILEWPSYLQNMDNFSKFSLTAEDTGKALQYRARANFVRDFNSSNDHFTYLKKIELKAKVFPIDLSNISRAVQLITKTNQFNVRTVRHSESDLLTLVDSSGDLCFLVQLTDIYGDHGIVGMVCMKEIAAGILFLDTFLMSCRVLGRNLDTWMLSQAIEKASARGYGYLVGQYLKTPKNSIAKDFFINNGFEVLNSFFDKIKLDQLNKDFGDGDFFVISTDIFQSKFLDLYEKN